MRKPIKFAVIASLFFGCTHKPNGVNHANDVPRPFVAKSTDGTSVSSWFYPQSAHQQPKGLVVYLHGGPHISVKDDMPVVIEFFRQNGYSVLGVDYRGSGGYGDDFQNSIKGDLGRLEVEDVYSSLNAFIAEHPAFSKSPVYLAGHSYGGFLALLIATEAKNPFQKIVAMASPTDLDAVFANVKKCALPQCQNASREMREDMYGKGANASYLSERNPVKRIPRIKVPVYLVLGEYDQFIPLDLTKKFVSAAKKSGKNVHLLTLPGVGHGLGSIKAPQALAKSLSPISDFLREQ